MSFHAAAGSNPFVPDETNTRQLRDAFGRFATGVTIVTAATAEWPDFLFRAVPRRCIGVPRSYLAVRRRPKKKEFGSPTPDESERRTGARVVLVLLPSPPARSTAA